MKKLFLISITIFVFTTLQAESEWTVLVYMAADNNLSQQSFIDINEMEMVTESPEITTLIQIDPYQNTYYPPYFTTSRRYLIRQDDNPDSIGSELIADLGEINSADPVTLSDFANWGFSFAPSEKRMLIIWDHGNGWTKEELVKSVCYDDYYDDRMSVADGELRQAIEDIDFDIDIIVFDACLMQMVEVITEIYEFCDIIVGSVFSIPADGILYGAYSGTACAQYGLLNFLHENSTCSPETLADEMVYRYINSYTTQCQYGSTISFSAIRTENFSDLLNRMHDFTFAYSDSLYRQLYHTCRSECLNFTYDYIDLHQFFYKVYTSKSLQTDAMSIASLIDSITISYSAVYQNVLYPEVGRMSINFPPELDAFSWIKYSDLLFRNATQWDRFLSYYMNIYNETPCLIDFSVSSISELVKFSWEVIATTELTYKLFYKFIDDPDYQEIVDSSIVHSSVYTTNFPDGDYSFKLEATDEFGNSISTIREKHVERKNLFQFYPNPLVVNDQPFGFFVISTLCEEPSEISVYNLNGDLIKRILIEPIIKGTTEILFDPKNVSSGIYFCLLRSGSEISTTKIAIVR